MSREALSYAELNGYDTVLLDTAGRLHDAPLMEKLSRIKAADEPRGRPPGGRRDDRSGRRERGEERFHEKLTLTVVLTKTDRRRPRRGGPLDPRGDRGPGEDSSERGEARRPRPFPPERMASASSGWATCFTLRRRRRTRSTKRRRLERKLQSVYARVPRPADAAEIGSMKPRMIPRPRRRRRRS